MCCLARLVAEASDTTAVARCAIVRVDESASAAICAST